MKICERAEIKITKEEIIQVLKMGYEDKEILSWGFIKLFQENKNELKETEERLRRIKGLIEYLKIETTEGELLMLIQMRYTDGDIISKDFIEKFQKNKEKLEKEIKKILDEYLRKFNDDDEENELSIEETVQKLLKERKEVIGTVTEIEIRKLLEWGYNSRAILNNRIIFQYRKLKIELDPYEEDDKKVKEKLRDYILELEKDDYDTDNSEKIGEMLSPEEYEEWDENIENIRKDEIENIINMEEFNLSQELDKNSILINNSDTESEENIMAATRVEILRVLEAALEYSANTLDEPLGAGQSINERIEELHRENVLARGGLKEPALRWYREMKKANVENVVNWTNENNDNNLKEKIRQKFEGVEEIT
ncbi:hypothetical protein C1646_776098 [Rhizophagus diaphanus]|nr:hypothetical protein C1646_776098 [Rhizophagus diaphanus] [Rhizophagus sp. MUCL 43196]